jgi:dolichyl-phosphate-mannose-protein mannosyltransferase
MNMPGNTEFEGLLDASGRSEETTRQLQAYERRTLTDRLWDSLATTPARERLVRAVGPILVILLAAGTRLWNLGNPKTLVFDETFYVKDAYTLSKLGYEGSWPPNPDPGFAAGKVNDYLTPGSFVVHPPHGNLIK